MEARPPIWRNVAENPQPLIFAVSLLALVVGIGAEVWTSSRALLFRPDAVDKKQNAEQLQPQYAEQIIGADLFGHAASQNNLPETSLQVTLRAVFAARDSKQASAVIETSDGHAQVIKVGANVAGDATLQEVHENRIVLARNGVLETLFFPAPQESTDFAIAQAAPPPSAENSTEAAAVGPLPANASPDEIKRAAILQRLEELRARSSR